MTLHSGEFRRGVRMLVPYRSLWGVCTVFSVQAIMNVVVAFFEASAQDTPAGYS